MSSCAGILLAGGQSRRMGRDKALLPFGAEALAERLYHVLASTCSEVVVIRDPAKGFPVPEARVIGDRHPDRGPLEGIATGLEQIRADRAIVVACD
ncbi:MAG TPA: molybdenum cofactor guanylyltransferase, partial [Stenomitos sp.]